MSSSASPAVDHRRAAPEVHSFSYPEAPPSAETEQLGPDTNPVQANAEGERREAAAREAGRREGEAQAQGKLQAELAQARDAIAQSLQSFSCEREAYYQRVEAEVVSLALNIARKILHREAQLDPLLLAGMVRVALEQIEAGTSVTVRTRPERAHEWREYFRRVIDPQDLPEIVEDPTLQGDCCVIQTQLGKTELGIDIQLKEIERGLLDLLAQRPQADR